MTRTRNSRRLEWLLTGVALLLAASVNAWAQAKVDINGPWIFTVQGDAGAGTATVTFKVEGQKVSGHISSALFGEQDLTGTLEGQALEFTFSGDAGQVIFKATAESSSAMKGALDIPGGGTSGTFTAKRKE